MDKIKLERKQEFRLPTGILSASLASDGQSLVAGCMDGVYLLEFDSQERTQLFTHDSYVSSVALPTRNQILSAGYDGNLCWYDLENRDLSRKVALHDFWSWDMAVSPDGQVAASVTGQYLAGGYKYEPAAETEPSLKLVSVESGEILHGLPHVPSVQAVAFSRDSQFVAAGNIMGEVRVFDVGTGKQVSSWTTPDFTSWGVIKSHCYLGGVFALQFSPDDTELLLAGMGPMRDPMAGNGKQLWQKWKWNEDQPVKTGETHKGQAGEGLMETLAIHPSGDHFVMGGRLRGGDWNVAAFALESGEKLAELKTGFRVTQAEYSADGKQLLLVGAQGQPKKKKDGRFPDFGRVELYGVDVVS